MNPHDRTGSTDYPAPDYLLGRLFAMTLLGTACFIVGYTAGESRGYNQGRLDCKVVSKKTTADLSNDSIRRWSRYIAARGAL